MEKKSMKEIVSTIMKAITLAMGVAVVALSCIGNLETNTAVILLEIGLACTGISMLQEK